MDQTGGRYEGEIKRLKKLTERLEAEKQHYRRLYERQLEVGLGGDRWSDGSGGGRELKIREIFGCEGK